MSNSSLANICNFMNGGTPSKKRPEYFQGDIPWISSADIVDGEVTEPRNRITKAAIAESATNLVPKGTVLLVTRTGVGKVTVAPFDLCFSQDITAIIPKQKDKFLPEYLAYFLQSCEASLKAQQRGATIQGITREALKSLNVPVKSLEIQKRIVDRLTLAKSLRTKRQKTIVELDSYFRSLFIEMFGDPVTNPKGWEVLKLSEFVEFLTSGSRGWAEYYADSGAIFIRIQNVKDTRLVLDDVAFVNAPDNAEAKRTKVRPGDLLISITADLGRTCVIPTDVGDAYINQHLALIRLKNINPLYIANFIESAAGMAQLLKLNRAAVKAGLNFNDIRSLEIPIPPLELQNKFEAKWLQHQQLRRQLLTSQNDIQNLFASLLSESFSGGAT